MEREEEMPQCVDNHTQLCPWIELSSSCSYGLSSAHPAHMGSGTRGCPLPSFPPAWYFWYFFALSGTFWYFPSVWYFHLCPDHQADTYGHPTRISLIPEKVSLFICGTFVFPVFIVLSMYGVDHDQATAKVLMHLGT